MDEAAIKVVVDVIQQLGFPIFVSIWLLWKSDKQMDKMQQTLDKLTVIMEKCTGRSNNGEIQ